MKHFDVGATTGSPIGSALGPRRASLVGVEARDEREAVAKLMAEWHVRYGDASADVLIGMSRAY
jgi:hypothetical protein